MKYLYSVTVFALLGALVFTIILGPSAWVAGILAHSHRGSLNWLKGIGAAMGIGGFLFGLVGLLILWDEKRKRAKVWEAYFMPPLFAIIIGPVVGLLAAIPGIILDNVRGVATIAVIGFVVGGLIAAKAKHK
jgi:hypothetical protein